MKRIAPGWLLIAVTGMANAQDKPNVVIVFCRQRRLRRHRRLWCGRNSWHAHAEHRRARKRKLASDAVPGGASLHAFARRACMSGRYSQRLGLEHGDHRRHAELAAGRRGHSRRAVQITGLRHRHHRQMASRSERAELADTPGFDEYKVGVFKSSDGTLYRDAMQRIGMPEAAIAAAEPGIWESGANGGHDEGTALHHGQTAAKSRAISRSTRSSTSGARRKRSSRSSCM